MTTSFATAATASERPSFLRAAVRVETLTVVWMVIEAAVAIGAGVMAHSLLLIAFGLDSVVELITGSFLLWRLRVETDDGSMAVVERAERRAAWVVAVSLIALCVYVLGAASYGLVTHSRPDASPAGILLAVAALGVMPYLAWRKRFLAAKLGSPALRGDAACSVTCAYMAATLLVGLALNALLGWWWAESLATLALLIWLIPEAREAVEGARAGEIHCACEE